MKLDDVNDWQHTPLLIACMQSMEQCAIALIQAGADIQVKCRNEKTPLHHAALKGMTDCVKSLLRRGADMNLVDSDDNTALMLAVMKNKPQTVLALLQYGSSTNILGRCVFDNHYTWCSPTEAATHLGHFDIAKMLYTVGGHFEFLHCFDNCFIIRSNKTIAHWMDELKARPRSLMDICRIRLREAVNKELNFLESVRSLPLPKCMKNYVAFYDLALVIEE